MFLISMTGCSAPGHDDYLNFKNSMLGKKIPYTEPFKFESAGKLIRADFLIGGPGLTHISKNEGTHIGHPTVCRLKKALPKYG